MQIKIWEPLIKQLSVSSRAIAYGIWNEDGHHCYLNEVFEDLKTMGGANNLTLENPAFDSFTKSKKENDCIFVGYITFGMSDLNKITLYSKVFYQKHTYLIFSYLDIIETLEDNKKLSKLNQNVNNLQRKLSKEKFNLEIAYEELKTTESHLLQRTEELEKSNELLFNINREKNEYIGMVAHDLRNPIGVLFSYANLMLDDLDDLTKEDFKLFLERIINSSEYSLNMMEEFLDASKIESGILNINAQPNDFIKCLSKSIQNIQVFANAKSQKMIVKNEPNQLVFDFDWDKMQQVIDNLLSNAIKYSEINSKIYINFRINVNTFNLDIIDEGQGIAEDEIYKVFKAFETTSAKATAGEKSTGLGLSIVKKIVEAHNGKIDVSSQLGKGTTFTVEFPLKTP